MGCSGSKVFRTDYLDDSIHVMLKRDDRMASNCKTKNSEATIFSARAPHPLLLGMNTIGCEERAESVTDEESDILDHPTHSQPTMGTR